MITGLLLTFMGAVLFAGTLCIRRMLRLQDLAEDADWNRPNQVVRQLTALLPVTSFAQAACKGSTWTVEVVYHNAKALACLRQGDRHFERNMRTMRQLSDEEFAQIMSAIDTVEKQDARLG